ncbi:MAG: DUF1415 domain-containing protein [Cycloclasticus sp.]
MVSEQSVIDSCQQWVSTVVVGLNFCPFAKSVIEAKGLAYTVIDERDIARCLKIFCDELNNLAASESIETKLLIYPQGFESFDDYLELAALAEALLIEEGYEGVFQLATFHPDYCFEGQKQDDPSNYTNRSPYPMLHLIREATIEAVLKNVANPEKIPARNIHLARSKGRKEMEHLFQSCQPHD